MIVASMTLYTNSDEHISIVTARVGRVDNVIMLASTSLQSYNVMTVYDCSLNDTLKTPRPLGAHNHR